MITPIRGRKPDVGIGSTVSASRAFTDDNPDKGTETLLPWNNLLFVTDRVYR